MANLSNINNKFLVTTGGNVGINNTSPGAKLVVGANVNSNASGIEVNAGAGGGNVLSNGTADNWFPYIDNNNYYSALDHIFRSQTNSATRMTIKSSGNVGIGTPSPGRKLTVTGDTSGDANNLLLSNENDTDGDSASIGFSMLSNNTYVKSGIFFKRTTTQGRGDLIFATNNEVNGNNVTLSDAKITIQPAGNVGIGTNSPDWALDIEAVSTGVQLQIGRTTTNAGSTWMGSDSSGFHLGVGAYGAGNSVSDPNGFTVLTSGNVGIGTTSPTLGKLQVSGKGYFGPVGTGNATSKPTMQSNAVLRLKPHDNNSTNMNFAQVNDGEGIGIQVTNGPGTSNWDIALSPFGGNVGIGTTSPSKLLHVNGSYKLGTNGFIEYGGGYPYTINIENTAGAGDVTIKSGAGYNRILLQPSTSGIEFYTGNSERMRINSSGDVGIGVTSPSAKLQVGGSISSGTGTAPTQISYDSNGNVNAFTHNFSEVKNTPSARNVTFVNVSGLGNFHQSFFYVQYGTRLQGVSDSTTGVVIRTYGVNRFNGGTLQVTETNAIAGSSNSLTHALVSVQIVSNTEYRLIVQFSSTLGASSFVSGEIKGYGVGDSFPTITFAEGASAN